MKQLLCFLGFAITTLLLTSCSTKECKCVDTNLTLINDSIDQHNSRVDTVYNDTRSDCEQFNKDVMYELDSIRKLHHKIICEEN